MELRPLMGPLLRNWSVELSGSISPLFHMTSCVAIKSNKATSLSPYYCFQRMWPFLTLLVPKSVSILHCLGFLWRGAGGPLLVGCLRLHVFLARI
jgi:hypothetical protein